MEIEIEMNMAVSEEKDFKNAFMGVHRFGAK